MNKNHIDEKCQKKISKFYKPNKVANTSKNTSELIEMYMIKSKTISHEVSYFHIIILLFSFSLKTINYSKFQI